MYLPAHFAEDQRTALHALIAQHPFGTLVTHGASGLDANHLPFTLVDADTGSGVLHAHVARANPVWQQVATGDAVLVIFRAGDAYVSPSWYPSKHEMHEQVPTWNYQVVHAHGRIEVRDDEKFVRGVVARLTRTHEAAQAVPWKMADAEPDYLRAMLQAIVGLRIEITQLVGKLKLGQNKDPRDIEGAADALLTQGERQIGEAMKAHAAQKAGRKP